MFKKEYFFVFVILGLSVAYAAVSLVVVLTRGKWNSAAHKKIAIGAMIVAFTAIMNCGSIAFSQEATPSPDPVPIYTTLAPTPEPTPETTLEPLPEYGIVTDTPGPPIPLYGIIALGDVNMDGEIDIVDGLLISQHYVGLNPVNFNTSSADVDCSGKIDIVDALLVAQMYVGLIREFPPCENNN
ncbi:MAG: dockerin type I repeat-containing protein [Spirochaetales bacterium]|nr:dockerin type I repeat-containing protein [Spirochaetales bacterium]